MCSEPLGDVLTGLAILSNSALALDICSPLFRLSSRIPRPDILVVLLGVCALICDSHILCLRCLLFLCFELLGDAKTGFAILTNYALVR